MARKPPKGKSLAELNHVLAKQWHKTKNGDLQTIFKVKISGHLAFAIENECKRIYVKDGYLSKDELPDGFTETIKYSEESIHKIKSIVDEVLTKQAEKKK